jgi:hypothetical protein
MRTLVITVGAAKRDPKIHILEYAFGFLGPNLSERTPPIILDTSPPEATIKPKITLNYFL